MPAASEGVQLTQTKQLTLLCRSPLPILRVGSLQVAGVKHHRYRVAPPSVWKGESATVEFACPPKVLSDLILHTRFRAILLVDAGEYQPDSSPSGVQGVVAHVDAIENPAVAMVHLDFEIGLDKLVMEGTQVRLPYPGGDIHIETWMDVDAIVVQAIGTANPSKRARKLTHICIKGRTHLYRISSGILLRGDVHVEVARREGTSLTVFTPTLDAPSLRLLRRWPPLVKRVAKQTDAQHRRVYSVDASPIAAKRVADTLVVSIVPAEMPKYHLHGGFLYHIDVGKDHESQIEAPVVREPIATVDACDGMQIDVDCEFAPSRDEDVAVDLQRVTIGDTILYLDTAEEMSSIAPQLKAVYAGTSQKRRSTRLVVRGHGRLDIMGEHPMIYGRFDVSLATRSDVLEQAVLAPCTSQSDGSLATQRTPVSPIGPPVRSALPAPTTEPQRGHFPAPKSTSTTALSPRLRNFFAQLENSEHIERYAEANSIPRRAAQARRSSELRALTERLRLDQDRQAAWEKLIAYASRSRAHEFMCLDTEFLIPVDIHHRDGWVSYCVWEDLKPGTATYVFRTPDFDTQSRVRAFLHEEHPKRNRLKGDGNLQRRLGYVGVAIHNNAGTNEADYWWERIRVRLGLQ